MTGKWRSRRDKEMDREGCGHAVEDALMRVRGRLNTEEGLAFAVYVTLVSCDWRVIGSNKVTWPKPTIPYAAALMQTLAPENKDKMSDLGSDQAIADQLDRGLALMRDVGYEPLINHDGTPPEQGGQQFADMLRELMGKDGAPE